MTRDLNVWGPRHAGEPTHPKTYAVAEQLGISHVLAYGHISAFRARLLLDAPDGCLRGGAREVERLALWDGEPGALAKAFTLCGVVDEIDEKLHAHEHHLYGGESIRRREAAAAATRRWRAKRKPSAAPEASAEFEREREPEGRDITGDVTGEPHGDLWVPSPLLSLSSSSFSAGEGVQGERVKAPKWQIPETAELALAMMWKGETLGSWFARVHPTLTLDVVLAEVEKALARIEAETGLERKQWGHARGFAAKLKSWMQQAEKFHLETQTWRARAARASGAVVLESEQGSSPAEATRRMLRERDKGFFGKPDAPTDSVDPTADLGPATGPLFAHAAAQRAARDARARARESMAPIPKPKSVQGAS